MKHSLKFRIRRGIVMLLAFAAMFMMFGFVGRMDCETISVEKGFIGAASCLLWFSALMYLAGGFRKNVGRKRSEKDFVRIVNSDFSNQPLYGTISYEDEREVKAR